MPEGEWRAAAGHLVFAILLSGVAFARLIPSPFAYDDLAVLSTAARWQTGQYRWVDLLFLPHNEHFIPGLRTLVASFGTRFGGWAGGSATAVHVLLVIWHGFGGWWVGRLVARTSGSVAAAFAITAFYVTSATSFAPSAIWYATGAVAMVSWVASLGSVWAIVRGNLGLGTALGWGGLLLGTTGGLPGLAAPWFALLTPGPRETPTTRRRAIAVLWAIAAIATLLAVRAVYSNYSGSPFPSADPRGWRTAALLIGSAPGRLVRAYYDDFPHGPAMAVGWLLVLGGVFLLSRRGRWVTAAVFCGAVALAAATGVMRPAESLAHFEVADRYYYALLAPLSLALAGWFVGLGKVRGWAALSAGCAVAVLPLWTGQSVLTSRFPASGLASYEDYWRRVDALLDEFDAEVSASDRPWRLVDGQVPGDRVQSGGLRLSHLMAGSGRGALARLAKTGFSRPPSGPSGPSREDQSRQNAVLDRWAEDLGEVVTPICVQDGELRPPGPLSRSWIDFAETSGAPLIGSGWEPWSPPFRFLGAEPARIRLEIAPGDLVVRVMVPPLRESVPEIVLSVSLGGRPLGVATAPRGHETELRFPLDSSSEEPSLGALVDVGLSASPTWRPVEHLPGNLDGRVLSLAVLQLGFQPAVPQLPKTSGAQRCG